MSKKTYNLVVGIVSVVCTGANVIVAYMQPTYMAPIIGAIEIAHGAIVEICSLFLKQE